MKLGSVVFKASRRRSNDVAPSSSDRQNLIQNQMRFSILLLYRQRRTRHMYASLLPTQQQP